MTFTAEDWHNENTRTIAVLNRIEIGVLGSILLDPKLRFKTRGLQSKHFYDEIKGAVFHTMKKSFPDSGFDATLLAYQLELDKVPCPNPLGWLVDIKTLDDHVVFDEDFDQYVDIVIKDYAIRRAARAIAQ